MAILTEEEFNNIIEQLINNKVEILNLSSRLSIIDDVDVGGEKVKRLAEALKDNTSLKKLSLAYNLLGDAGVTFVANALVYNNTLTELNISGNKIGAEGANEIANALVSNKNLAKLDIGNNKIGDAGVTFVANALVYNNTLTELDISMNLIGDTGVTSVAKALGSNNTLNSLVLFNNKIGAEGANEIANALVSNKNLAKLYIGSNKIGDAGVTSVAKALGSNNTLTELDISMNQIGDAGFISVVKALGSHNTLITLSIMSNTIGEIVAVELVKTCLNNPNFVLKANSFFVNKPIREFQFSTEVTTLLAESFQKADTDQQKYHVAKLIRSLIETTGKEIIDSDVSQVIKKYEDVKDNLILALAKVGSFKDLVDNNPYFDPNAFIKVAEFMPLINFKTMLLESMEKAYSKDAESKLNSFLKMHSLGDRNAFIDIAKFVYGEDVKDMPLVKYAIAGIMDQYSDTYKPSVAYESIFYDNGSIGFKDGVIISADGKVFDLEGTECVLEPINAIGQVEEDQA